MGAARLAVVLVHYHTPDLVAEAVAALRADLAGSGDFAGGVSPQVQWLLVDNGSEPEDRATFERLGLERLDPGTNSGYAGGVNLGMEHSEAPVTLVMNPDVLVAPGCVAALYGALEGGAAVAGPRFFWDREQRLLLPPAEPRTRHWEVWAALASRGPRWAARARARWRRQARRHWLTTETLPSYDLSGALLAIRRDAWNEVGPFDSGYSLYFEETDWVTRVRRAGLPSAYVPAARAVHLYNRSAALEPRAAAWFAASRQRYRRRYYGAAFSGLLTALERPAEPPSAKEKAEVPDSEGAPRVPLPPHRPLWLELSPNPTGFPAAAQRLDAVDSTGSDHWELAEETWQGMTPGPYALRWVNEAGEELGEHRIWR